MPWTHAGSRLALTLRRLRGRFGIFAPQVAIRTHVPWYWRAVSIGAIFVLLLGFAVWVFDAGRQIAGFDLNEFNQLKSAKVALEEEIERLRSLVAASENNQKIEQAAQQVLVEKNRALVDENNRLKEELAVLERLSKRRGKIEK